MKNDLVFEMNDIPVISIKLIKTCGLSKNVRRKFNRTKLDDEVMNCSSWWFIVIAILIFLNKVGRNVTLLDNVTTIKIMT